MPYIKQEMRNKLDLAILELRSKLLYLREDEIEGALNYTITSLLDVVKDVGEKRWRYTYINRVIGVLECLKLEFYRRLGVDLENNAALRNGDIKIYEKGDIN